MSTKQIEALKLALEALRDYRRSDDDRVSVAMGILQEALAEQPSQQQEPVAKVDYKQRDGFRWLNSFGWQRIPDGASLYTSPQPAQQQEPVAWAQRTQELLEVFDVDHPEVSGCCGVSPPASKPWVGLTQEQRASIAEANNMLVDDDLFDAIEAKLREKNA